MPKSAELDNQIEHAELDLYGHTRWGSYDVRLTPGDLTKSEDLVEQLMKGALEGA